MSQVTRFGISLEPDLLRRFDRLIRNKGYGNRSEAIRDLIRETLVQQEWENETHEHVGTITLIYDHHSHDVGEKLTDIQHDHHHTVLSTMHIHLDHDHCLEVLAVKGTGKLVRRLADELISLKGVKHGKLVATSTGKNL
ncbi:nickel-responsive transcriptional regulator NikR [candidate division KSB1 bacterium]|nr:nickel-responsive transcriptional regulator NikR [candidate division KSB1 bacterium]